MRPGGPEDAPMFPQSTFQNNLPAAQVHFGWSRRRSWDNSKVDLPSGLRRRGAVSFVARPPRYSVPYRVGLASRSRYRPTLRQLVLPGRAAPRRSQRGSEFHSEMRSRMKTAPGTTICQRIDWIHGAKEAKAET